MRRSPSKTRSRVSYSAKVLPLALVVVGALPASAAARTATAAQNNTPPTISGSFRQGSALTASNGTWSFTPSSFTYQWQRCDSDGGNCSDLRGATAGTYTLTAGDVTHTVVVMVVASNAFTVNDATSDPTPIVASTTPPANDVQPAITGTAQIGQTLSVSNGVWIPAAASVSYQWQLCGSDGSDCLNITGATKPSFQITRDHALHTFRALVTAQTAGGETATMFSNTTGKVPPPPGTQQTKPVTTTATTTTTGSPATTTPSTTTTTTTATPRRPPTLIVLALRRTGVRVHASFRVCASPAGVIAITERESKGKAQPQTRRFSVNVATCSNLSRDWPLLARFRGPGQLVVTMQARDRAGAVSRSVSRSLVLQKG